MTAFETLAVLTILDIFALPLVLRLIWNFVMPDITGMCQLTYLQAFFLKLGADVLFGGSLVRSWQAAHRHQAIIRALNEDDAVQ